MNIHKNARLTPLGRARLVRRGVERADAAGRRATAGVCPRTVRKWVARYQAEGAGRPARSLVAAASSAPATPRRCRADRALRRQRCTGKQIAATVGRLAGHCQPRPPGALGSAARGLEPAEPVRRYERQHPGELIHIDIKKLGRFDQRRPSHHRRPHRLRADSARRRLGVRPRLHRRRLAHRLLQIMPDEKKESAVAFLKAAVAYYNSLGITVARVMTDNGSATVLRLPRRLQGPRPQTHPHQALHAQNQRQSRALHPDRAARMGLCPAYPTSDRRAPRAPHLAASLQLASTTRRHKIQNRPSAASASPRTTC